MPIRDADRTRGTVGNCVGFEGMLDDYREDGSRRLMPDDGASARTPAGAVAEIPSVKVVTYNIHSCIGVDRRCDPARIGAVLREIDADIACLQEVDARRGVEHHVDQWAYLGAATGRRVILGAGLRDYSRRFGNAILTRFPVLAARSLDLTVGGYEPRGAIEADLLVGDRVLRVLATHFGLHAAERRLQANRLMAALGDHSAADRRAAHAVLLMGDLNEWRGRTGAIRVLDWRLGPSEAPRTFPSWLPVLPLDRIYADGPAVLREVCVYRSPLARLASDHLPLLGNLYWSARDPPHPERPPQTARRRSGPNRRRAARSTVPDRGAASETPGPPAQ
jgi:endonuclease/exonuclease/phosphatase family metal-dependent hydrolase